MAYYDAARNICQALGVGRRRGVQTTDPDRMLLIEMRADFSAKLPLGYNAIEQDDFWAKHPDIVAARLVQLVNTSSELIASVSWDIARGGSEQLKRNERTHVQALRRVLTSLAGPHGNLTKELSLRMVTLP